MAEVVVPFWWKRRGLPKESYNAVVARQRRDLAISGLGRRTKQGWIAIGFAIAPVMCSALNLSLRAGFCSRR